MTFDPRCAINPATGTGPAFRDLSGTRPALIPTWTVSASATINHNLGENVGAFLRGEYDYQSKAQLTELVPASISTYGVNNVNASLGFSLIPQKVELLFFVRNLTKNNQINFAFPTVAQTGSYSGFLNDPRTYGATLTKRF